MKKVSAGSMQKIGYILMLVYWANFLFAQQDTIPQRVVLKMKTSQATSLNAKVFEQDWHKIAISPPQPFVEDLGSYNSSKNSLGEREGFYMLALRPEVSVQEALNFLAQQPEVLYAEPLYVHYPMDSPKALPNDPGLSFQYYLDKIKAKEAWELPLDAGKGNSSMLVGIVDSGFDLSHEDLTNKHTFAIDIGDLDFNLSGDAHGTQVAGAGFAEVNNAKGIAGVAYNCRFVPIKASVGSSPIIVYGYDGILYAAEQGCKVINISWGRTGSPGQFEQEFLRYIVNTYDVVLVAAGGNENTETYYYPAAYDEVLAVAGSNSTDLKWSSSSYYDRIGITAPGENITTTSNGNVYGNISGTSFAAPIVSAAAAMVRVKFPNLKASQVIAQLKASADLVQANIDFAGKMGTGRLNIEKALTENNLQFVDILEHWTTPTSNPAQLYLNITLRNELADVENLSATLSTTSTQVAIIENTVNIGNLTTLQQKQQTKAFLIELSPTIPDNTLVTFQITYNGTNFSQTQYFKTSLSYQPDYLNLSTDSLKFTVANQGLITAYSPPAVQKAGLTYQGFDVLGEAGFMLVASETKISTATRGTQFNTFQQSFTVDSKLSLTNSSNDIFQEISGVFEDITGNASRVGVFVTQKAYAWKEANAQKFVILEYRIQNRSGQEISTLHTGIFANWEVEFFVDNKANYDATRNLGYIYKPNGKYVGIKLLTAQKPLYYAFDNNGNSGSINLYDGFTDAEKYQALSQGVFRAEAGTTPTDVSHVMGATLENFEDKTTQIVAFALLVGDNLTDLQAQADFAQQKFKAKHTSPKPEFTNPTICAGQDVLINPENTRLFKIYEKLPASSSTLINTATAFQVMNIQNVQKIYITNIDSLYESEPTEITITPVLHETSFTQAKDTLNLTVDKTVQFEDKSTGAVAWEWNFGDGQSSNLQHPTHTFTQTGLYVISLKSTNALGCQDEFQRLLWVIQKTSDNSTPISPVITSLTNIEEKNLKIYPNPADENIILQFSEDILPTNVRIWNTEGKLQWLGVIYDHESEINTQGWVSGTYFIAFEQGERWFTQMLIIRH